MTQNERILKHMKSGKSLDPLTALKRFSTMRLASRICELRAMGHNIIARKKTVKNRHGEPCVVCDYKLMIAA